MPHLKKQIEAAIIYNKEEIRKLNASLAKFPPGRMRCYKNGNSVRYVLLTAGKPPQTIPKKQTNLIKIMAQKAVFEARKKDCEAELKICTRLLKEFEACPHAMDTLLANSEICSLLSQKNPETDINVWQNSPYDKNPNYPEGLTIPTEAGIYVRSKDEALCVSGLIQTAFPFRYEQKHVIGGKTLYPDFTLLHPASRRIIIMELFGMMDNPDYARNTGQKLQLYFENGYMPGYNLICFFSSLTRPLNIMEVINTLRHLLQ